MREQVATPVSSPPTERKKTGIKVSRRHENNDDNKRRRLGLACIGHYGGKPVMHMPGERLAGGSWDLLSKDQDLNHNVQQPSAEKMNEDARDEIENERMKCKGSEDRVVLPQWGQRKRPRCNRVDLKHVADELSVSRKTGGEERQLGKAEKGVEEEVVVRRRSGEKDAMEKVEEKRQELHARLSQSNNDRGNSNNNDRPASNSCPPAEELMPQANGHNSPQQEDEHHHASPPFSSSHTLAVFKVDLDLFQWPRILLSLSRKEKEDDFFTIKGSKLPQRPKRRPKAVEKALNYCSPGTWLGDLSRGRYDVREKKRAKKKPRGLKAMESMDTDSD